jgi:tRNA U34 5-methylaminomethyl-2-thiouridine-forming methyltransferase MnmC
MSVVRISMKSLRACVLACLLSGFTLIAFAASPPAPGNLRKACGQDIHTLCKGVKPGNGAIRQCMRQNWRKFSPGCKAAVRARRQQKAAAAAAPSS